MSRPLPEKRSRVLLLLAVGLLSCLPPASTATAQMFGSRTLGPETVGRRTRPGAASNEASGLLGNPNLDPGAVMTSGLMNPGARFIRGNRGAADFVGRDFGETRDFVGGGGEMTAQALRSAINELRPLAESDANRQQPTSAARKNTLYPPRLRLDFSVSLPEGSRLSQGVAQHVDQALGQSPSGPLEVTVTGRTAILRGEVASAHERNLAAALASLEPGIDAVQNDLIVIEERDSGPPSPAENAQPAEPDAPQLVAPSPSRSESLAPRSSSPRQPVVQPVAP